MSDIINSAENGLKGHVGRFPVWGIAVGVGAIGIVGYYVYSRRNAANAAVADTGAAATTATSAGTDTTGIVDPTYSTAGYNTANDSAAVDTGSTGYSSNATWLAAAATAVAAEKNASFFDVSNGLMQYLNGNVITPTQKGYVDTAIGLKGYPPEGVTGISSVSTPATVTPATTPATPAGATTVVAKTPVLGYAESRVGVYYAVQSWSPFRSTVVSSKTARANGVKWKVSGGGTRIAGPGVSYLKVKGASPIYAVCDGKRYHLSADQYAWIGHPHYSEVAK